MLVQELLVAVVQVRQRIRSAAVGAVDVPLDPVQVPALAAPSIVIRKRLRSVVVVDPVAQALAELEPGSSSPPRRSRRPRVGQSKKTPGSRPVGRDVARQRREVAVHVGERHVRGGRELQQAHVR